MPNHPQHPQRRSIRNRLEELRHREPPPGADASSRAAFTDAEAFAEHLPIPLRDTPHISLAADGELNFAWSGGSIYVDIGFYGTGAYSFFARDQQGRTHHGDDIPTREPLPDALQHTLSAGSAR